MSRECFLYSLGFEILNSNDETNANISGFLITLRAHKNNIIRLDNQMCHIVGFQQGGKGDEAK